MAVSSRRLRRATKLAGSLSRITSYNVCYTKLLRILVHERLAIVDPSTGAQPLYNPEHTHVLAVNGEIYNHKALEAT